MADLFDELSGRPNRRQRPADLFDELDAGASQSSLDPAARTERAIPRFGEPVIPSTSPDQDVPEFAALADAAEQRSGDVDIEAEPGPRVGTEAPLQSLARGTLNVGGAVARTPETVRRATEGLESPLFPNDPLSTFSERVLTPITEGGEVAGFTLPGTNDAAAAFDREIQSLAERNPRLNERIERFNEEANQAFSEAAQGDFSKLGAVVTSPERMGSFIGQALPSFAAAAATGGNLWMIAALETAEITKNAEEFTERTGIEVSPEEFRKAVALTGGVNALLERTGLRTALGNAPGRTAASKFFRTLLGGGTEAGTEALQETNTNLATRFFDPEQPLGEGVGPAALGGGGVGTFAAAGAQQRSTQPAGQQPPPGQAAPQPGPETAPSPAPDLLTEAEARTGETVQPEAAPTAPSNVTPLTEAIEAARVQPQDAPGAAPEQAAAVAPQPAQAAPAPETAPTVAPEAAPDVEPATAPDQAPDLLDEAAARGPEAVPEPAPTEAPETGIPGDPVTVFTPNNEPVETRYEVVEADDLVASHQPDGRPNPNFPAERQPRQRERAASQQQIQQIARELNPALLEQSPTTDTGAPIVDDQNIVESGNGRVAAIQLAAREANTEGLKDYLIDNAERFGIPADQIANMRNPVLVRRRTTQLDEQGQQAFARASNVSSAARLAPAEQARSDAQQLTDEDLSLFEPGEDGNVLVRPNRPFVNRFLERVGGTEAAALVDPQGRPNREAVSRMQAAVFQKAYRNDDLVQLAAEEADPDVRNILSGLQQAAPAFARARSVAPDLADLDVVTPLVGAIQLVRDSKRAGQSLQEALGQQSLFEASDPDVSALASFLDTNKRSGRRLGAGLRAMGATIERELRSRQNQSLLGDEARLSPSQVIRDATQQAQPFDQPAAQAELLAGGQAQPAARRGGPSGQPTGRQRAEAGEAAEAAPGEVAPARQPVNNFKALLDRAERAEPSFRTTIESLADTLGGQVVYPPNGPVKGRTRAREKVDKDYGGVPNRIKDLIRATITFDTPAQVNDAFNQLQDHLTLTEDPGNRNLWADDSAVPASGYRDAKVTFFTDDGLVAELQLNTESMLEAKLEAEEFYHRARTITGNERQAGHVPPRPAAQRRIDELEGRQREIYANAVSIANDLSSPVTTASQRSRETGAPFQSADAELNQRGGSVSNAQATDTEGSGITTGIPSTNRNRAVSGSESREGGRASGIAETSTGREGAEPPGVAEASTASVPTRGEQLNQQTFFRGGQISRERSAPDVIFLSPDREFAEFFAQGRQFETGRSDIDILADDVTDGFVEAVRIDVDRVFDPNDATMRGQLADFLMREHGISGNAFQIDVWNTSGGVTQPQTIVVDNMAEVFGDANQQAWRFVESPQAQAYLRDQGFDGFWTQERILTTVSVPSPVNPNQTVSENRARTVKNLAIFDGRNIRPAAADTTESSPDVTIGAAPVNQTFEQSEVVTAIRPPQGQRGFVRSRPLNDIEQAQKRRFAKIQQALRPILSRVGLAKDVPDAYRLMLRRFRAEVQKRVREAEEIARQRDVLTAEHRRMIADVMEGELAAGIVPPEHVRTIAAQMQEGIQTQTEELIRLGMLSRSTAERWRGRYLARYYTRREEPIPRALRKQFNRIDGSHLKGRGMFEMVQKREIEQWKKLGWEVRDPESDTQEVINNLRDNDKILMWRDYTPEERANMGEIRDAVYRYARGHMETGRDIALGRLFKAIAESDFASPRQRQDDQVQVPDTTIPGTGGVKRYGQLAGMWVQKDIWNDLEAVKDPDLGGGRLWQIYMRGLSMWKSGKTAMNPVVHSNNIWSSWIMADLYGISPWNVRAYREALQDYRNGGRFYQEAIDNGLFGTEFFGTEIGVVADELAQFVDMEQAAAGKLRRMQDYLARFSGARAYRRGMGRLYRAEDQFFKLVIYKDMREKGATIDEAIDEAERWIFNYADIPKGIRKIKNSPLGLPFLSYTYKATPALAYAAVTAPWRYAKWIALFGGFNYIAFALLFGPDHEEQEEKERRVMPEYMKGMTPFFVNKHIRWPFDRREGVATYLGLERRFPMGDMFDMNNQLGGIGIFQPLMPNNPVFTTSMALVGGKDSFTGRDIANEADSVQAKVSKYSGWMLYQYLPNSPILPFSYSFDKVMNGVANEMGEPVTVIPTVKEYTGKNFYGEEQTLARAFGSTVFGFKIREFDIDRQAARRSREFKGQLQDLRFELSGIARDESLTDAVRERQMQDIRERINHLVEEFREENE